jgi:AbrB family looped-hinge helix DNA binding protein
MAAALTKVGPKFQVTIPKKIREAVGLSVGDIVETTVSRDGIVLRRKAVVDRPDLTKRFEAAERAVKEGRVLGPFTTASAAMRALKHRARARRSH